MILRAVFFDVGNTLLRPFPSVSEVCRQVLAEAGHVHDLSAIDALMPLVDEYYEDRYRADDTFWTDEEETSSVWVGMYSLMCRRLGIKDDAVHLARRVYEEFGKPSRWAAYPDVLPALDRLRAMDLRLGVISNWDSRLSGLLEALGIGERMDFVLSSAEVGLHKPDPRIFELACERMGVLPEEAAHVGDHHYADVLGARAVGMTPVLIDRSGQMPLLVGPAPITDFDTLEAVLGLS
ncbi:MAG: HAD family hydrolase [Candidatus Melainabacteria bacterium HGW-Melainabacteria-1]|jgi:putative hydrolase of the HAD superfamily|nr:MAG: HAD family hydrolase [Candidatus Melainabacteria bacterium HGW-Melainabacteria-1]PKQ20699.1 MAG: HAD family hydrolase [Actinobacteria bacterium HGW-Actinobacteria-6]